MQRFINNWAAPLTAPLAADAAALQIAVDQAARLVGLGGGDHYLLTLAQTDSNGNEVAWEVVKATSVSGGQVSITRAQEGTVALSLPAGAAVSARLTAGSMVVLVQAHTDLQAQVQALGQGLAGLQQQVQELAERVSELEGGSVPDNALTNQAGEVLTNQAGEVLTIGATA